MVSRKSDHIAAKRFKRFYYDEDERNQKFSCTLYYLHLFGLSTVEVSPAYKTKLHYVLHNAGIPFHTILDVRFSTQYNAATLYFTNSFQRNKAKFMLQQYNKNTTNTLHVS